MTRPIQADDLVPGTWLVVTNRKFKAPPQNPYIGDTLQIIPIVPPEEPFEATGIPIYIQAISLPFVVGRPATAYDKIATIDLTQYEVRVPDPTYVAAFQYYNTDPRTVHVFHPKEPKVAKQSGKSTSSQASDIGSKGGKAGGPARAAKMTAQERKDAAKKGGEAKAKKGGK